MQSTEAASSERGQAKYSEAMESKAQKKLYQEEDIAKLAVLKADDTSVARKFAMCVAAASVAELATYPLDLTKTRCVRRVESDGVT